MTKKIGQIDWQADLEIDQDGLPIFTEDMKTSFIRAKAKGTEYGVAFNFTLFGWLKWWRTELRLIGPHATRGNRKGEYAMCRIDNKGPYEIGNVYAGTRYGHEYSQSNSNANRGKSYPLKGKFGADHPKAKPVVTPEGRFESIGLAAKALGLTAPTAYARVRLGKWQLATS